MSPRRPSWRRGACTFLDGLSEIGDTLEPRRILLGALASKARAATPAFLHFLGSVIVASHRAGRQLPRHRPWRRIPVITRASRQIHASSGRR
jgi:hypothetical protein